MLTAELQGRGPQRCSEVKPGKLFVNEAAFSVCMGRALPSEQCRVPGGISLGSPSAGQPCPERQANTDAAAQGSERSERPDPVSIKTVFTLSGCSCGMFHVQGSAAAMAALSLRVSLGKRHREASPEGRWQREHRHTGLGPPNLSAKLGKCGGDQVWVPQSPPCFPAPGWGT